MTARIRDESGETRIVGDLLIGGTTGQVATVQADGTLAPATGAPPSGSASGDLSGTYPAPTVAKVNGVAVTGTPSVGYVPTATGATAATWQAAATPAGVAIVRGPFAFAFNTSGINNGVTVWTPAVGDVLLDAWLEIDTAFDGTTPKADVGTFVGVNTGLFGLTAAVALTTADVANAGTGILYNTTITALTGAVVDASGKRTVPAKFTATNPLKLVVSQNGQKGGTAVGGTAGSGSLYIVTATPVALP